MTATIVPFPQRRNVGKARHVAAIYLGKRTNAEGAAYWKSAVDSLYSTLRRRQLTHEQASAECIAFRDAVQEQADLIEARTIERAQQHVQPDPGAA